ncbi:hypothetical protein RHMOL_Rhmol10G0273600 [Rhododendron molle]|uniref:Uncharacterized protein n=1 Tax=Rhododendron molle TaxID=49168 RepID=A0ACC0M892_RHOML|nr:hypothetical protein RHMOL_Rhmol10G0273600 [Rhododendron molle]
MVPGKTIEEIKDHYGILGEDIHAMEAGHVHLPHYKGSASRGGNVILVLAGRETNLGAMQVSRSTKSSPATYLTADNILSSDPTKFLTK